MAFDVSAFKTTDPLGDLAIRIANARTDYIATEVLPVKTLPKAHFKWYQHDKSHFTYHDTAKASKSEADKVSYNVFNTSGQALLHKLAADIDPQDERDADQPVADLENKATMNITERLLIDMEVKAHALISTAGNYPSGLTSALTTGATTWADSGGDPVQVVKDAKLAVRQNCAAIPNRMAAAYEVIEALRVHPALIERIKYTGIELPDALLLQLLGIQELRIAKALKVATREPTQTLSTIWGDSALIYWHDAADGLEAMTYGRTFMVEDIYTHRYLDDRRGGGAGRIRVVEMGWEFVQKIVAVESGASAKAIAGYLVQNAI